MASKRPDFRNMTPDEIRKDISRLNGTIKTLRTEFNRVSGKFFAGQAASIGLGVPATIIVPPLGLGIMLAGMLHGTEKTMERGILGAQLAQAEKERQSLKTVWRARPGRKFYDIDKRVKRENTRRAEKERKKIMRRYGGRFGLE